MEDYPRTVEEFDRNAEWVAEKRVGIVLHSFQEVVSGVQRMLDPTNLAEFRKNVAALENRAIFEIPEILDKLLRESAGTQAPSSADGTLQSVR